MATIHKGQRSGAKSASGALEDLLAKPTITPNTDKPSRKSKSAKSAKSKKGGKKGKKSKSAKHKKPAVSHEQLRTPAAMTNAYFICHNAPDFLFARGFKFKPKSAWETVPAHYKMRILGYC